jgi:single-stranded-DNA-specific exonuclease
MLNYRWNFKDKPDESTVKQLKESLKIPRSLAKVLIARGVGSDIEAKKFFDPSLEDIHDPFLMTGMDVAVDRIIRAVKNKELIWVHGDYDVDGTASTSMILQFIREIGGEIDYYIPDRFHEGYGLSVRSVDTAKSRGASLLVTVDVGITSYEPLAHAKKVGIDAIVCDHHEPGDEIPPALAILDPLKPNDPYPFKYLAASGVVFKFIQAISERLKIKEKAFEFLDYVAIASAADMVPLIGENRILSRFGLDLLNENPRPGLKGLIYCTQLKPGSINSSSIVYSLAPLINAAGRLGDAKRSVEMMTQKDEIAAFQIAQQLEQENRRRRAFDEATFEEAIPMAKKLLEDKTRRSLVIHKPDWHAGVIGIVASRLVDKFHVPTVLLTSIEGLAKGSARSINTFDIHSALKKTGHMLIEYGGHKHAAGLSLEESIIPEFRRQFDQIAKDKIKVDMLKPEINIDAELRLNELSPAFLTTLRRFAPFGFENYKPVFYSKNVTSANGIRILVNKHLKFRAYQSHFVIDAIAYNLAHKVNICTSGKPFSIVYNLEEVNYNGSPTIQLRIKDIRAEDE